jgi:hypothetical protein
MSDDDIKLTTTNNTTSNGTPFPETPKPQVLTEQFSRNEVNNPNERYYSDSDDN